VIDKLFDINGRLSQMSQCVDCMAIVNEGAYAAAEMASVEAMQKTDFYRLSEEEIRSVSSHIAATDGLFSELFRQVPSARRRVFCDFGAGRGFVAMQATKYFDLAFACEMDTSAVRQAVEATGGDLPNLRIASTLDEVTAPIDVLLMWHVLEHIPNPLEFWRKYKERLAPDAVVFLQIPLYRPQHVVHSHYVFYSEPSLSRWAESIDAVPLFFGYDVENSFLAMVARRAPKGASSKPGAVHSLFRRWR
jgi:SAM-dependent methyltransferase